MSDDVRVLRADDPVAVQLEAEGWTVAARSWGAELDATAAEESRLASFIENVRPLGLVRELNPDDVGAILQLDAATAGHYPGSIATRHDPLDRDRATPSSTRIASGFCTSEGTLVAVTFADLDGDRAEVDFTVVAREWRGKGIGTALKASAVLRMRARGIRHLRTGGSADNGPIIAVNSTLGFVIDEHWITLERPAG